MEDTEAIVNQILRDHVIEEIRQSWRETNQASSKLWRKLISLCPENTTDVELMEMVAGPETPA